MIVSKTDNFYYSLSKSIRDMRASRLTYPRIAPLPMFLWARDTLGRVPKHLASRSCLLTPLLAQRAKPWRRTVLW